MSLYAIGDVQGCDEELGALLSALRYSADRDRLWFVGDLVNRGPDSLAVLRRIRSLGDAATEIVASSLTRPREAVVNTTNDQASGELREGYAELGGTTLVETIGTGETNGQVIVGCPFGA